MIWNKNDYDILKEGRKIYKHIRFDNKKYNFVCSHGIGDVVWMCSFLQAYLRKQHIKDDVEFVCCKRDEGVIQAYFPFAKVRILNTDDLYRLGRFASVLKKERVKVCIYPSLQSGKGMLKNIQVFADLGIEMDIFYKYGCFALDYTDSFQPPCLEKYREETDNIIISKKLRIGKTIVLVPYTHSRLELDREYWSKIAKGLIERGYDVYTNVSSEKAGAIAGTKALYMPIEILPLLIKKIGYVISGRCGLGDWLFVNCCNMSVIHTFYFTRYPLGSNKQVQSSFGCRESFQNMKARCGLEDGILQEYRIAMDKVKEDLLEQIVADADAAVRRVF